MKKILLGKKIITLVSLIALTAIFFIIKNQVDKIIWQKKLTTAEHQLKLGSFIFSQPRPLPGKQTVEKVYLVFKVVHIDNDFVKLSVIRQLSIKDNLKDSDFSMTAAQYEDLKKTVIDTTITPIQVEDLHDGDGQSYVLNAHLLKKYPALKNSLFYYEDIADALKNKPAPIEAMQLNDYISLVYSREQIIKNGKLYPYSMNNYQINQRPELYPNPHIAEDIELIINQK
jgi:hypothetical protein